MDVFVMWVNFCWKHQDKNFSSNQSFLKGRVLYSWPCGGLQGYDFSSFYFRINPWDYLRPMIAYLRGKILQRGPTSVIIDCQGVGYEVRISLYTASAMDQKEEVSLNIYHHFSQDHQALFGFSGEAERHLFVLLISVSGVGPNTAQLILSYMSPQETEIAILGEDLAAFRKVKGVGEKTARRILVDLKDKVIRGSSGTAQATIGKGNSSENEALSALLALGFPRAQAQKALNRVVSVTNPTESAETLIRLALRELS